MKRLAPALFFLSIAVGIFIVREVYSNPLIAIANQSNDTVDNKANWAAGSITVAATTATQLPSNAIPFGKSLIVKALPTNTGYVYFSPLSSSATTLLKSFVCAPKESVVLLVKNSNQVWFSATVNTDGITWYVEK